VSGACVKARFEREFLKLAGTALAARLQIMGGEIDYEGQQPAHDGDLTFHLLGMTDYEGEMKLLCREARG
jgi:hypothetical protein